MLSSWRKRLVKEEFPLARKRAQALPTADLFNTVDAHLYYVSQAMTAWKRGEGSAAIEEAQKNILALLEITRELDSRTSA